MQSNYKDEMDVDNIEERLPDEEQTEATFLSSDEEDAGVEVADAEVEPKEVESEEDEDEEDAKSEEEEEAQEAEEVSNDSSEAADATETPARRSPACATFRTGTADRRCLAGTDGTIRRRTAYFR